MLTDLQQRKLAHTFKLWDANRDGVVEQADYQLLIDRVAAVRGWAPGSAGYQGLQQMYLGSWEAIRAYADTNRDNQVSLAEWMACFADWLKDPAAFRQMITPMSDAVFGLLDQDGDGTITRDEWDLHARLYNAVPDSTGAIFSRLDADGDGRIPKDEFIAVSLDFFLTDDPQAPANWMFGDF
jgi:juvenile hormone diol kinase